MFLRKGGPDGGAHLCLGVSAEHWALGCVVLRVCSGDWAKQRKRRVLTGHRVSPSGIPNPSGAAGDGQDPNDCPGGSHGNPRCGEILEEVMSAQCGVCAGQRSESFPPGGPEFGPPRTGRPLISLVGG